MPLIARTTHLFKEPSTLEAVTQLVGTELEATVFGRATPNARVIEATPVYEEDVVIGASILVQLP